MALEKIPSGYFSSSTKPIPRKNSCQCQLCEKYFWLNLIPWSSFESAFSADGLRRVLGTCVHFTSSLMTMSTSFEYPGCLALFSFCFLAPSTGTSSTWHLNEQIIWWVYLFILIKKKTTPNLLIQSLQLIYFSFVIECTFCKLNLPLFQSLNQSPGSKNTLLDLNIPIGSHSYWPLMFPNSHENMLLFLKRLDVAKQQVKTLSQYQQKGVLWN